MTKEEAIEKARTNYMNCYWDQETKLSNLYDECDELDACDECDDETGNQRDPR